MALVRQLDLSALVRHYAGRGSDAHHPGTLLALLIYGYATGVHVSRAIERASCDSVAEAQGFEQCYNALLQPVGSGVPGSDDRCIYTDR